MLAAPGPVDANGGFWTAAEGTAERTGHPPTNRLDPSHPGLQQRPGQKRGPVTGPNPTDRAKAWTKHHVATDGRGLPLAVLLSGANVHDKKMALSVVDAIPAIQGPRGRPRRRPGKLHADKAYDAADLRRELRRRGITPRIARGGIESSQRLGRYRWVVERTLAWLHGMKRLRVREERRADIHLALLQLGCSIILLRKLMERRGSR